MIGRTSVAPSSSGSSRSSSLCSSARPLPARRSSSTAAKMAVAARRPSVPHLRVLHRTIEDAA